MFQECSKGVVFEDIATGRKGSVLVKMDNKGIPIVRTTSVYKNPVQIFTDVHLTIMDRIKEVVPDSDFNNALIEIYDSRYKSMAFHSDQALDLNDESYIVLYSCYERGSGDSKDPKDSITSYPYQRKLITRKKTETDQEEILLDHDSFVVFSTDTNRKYTHKIILGEEHKNTAPTEENRWLGITFRLSKTFVKFFDNVPNVPYVPYIADQSGQYTELTHATHEEKKEYYKHRSLENKSIYRYPFIYFSISPSDFMNIEHP